jgi:hypothetical protein
LRRPASDGRGVGLGRCCSPRHRMPLKPTNEGLKCVNMGARGKARCLIKQVEASISDGGQGESLLPHYTCGRVSLTGARAKPWCLIIHPNASMWQSVSRSR